MRRSRLGIRGDMSRPCLLEVLARRGGRCPVGAPTVAVGPAGRLRCASRIARAAAVPLSAALNAPRTSRRPRRSDPFGAGRPLALLRCSPRHKSPPPGTAHRAETLVVFDGACPVGVGKVGGGQALARMVGAEQRSGPRGIATRLSAARRRACGAPSIGATRSVVPAMRGRRAEPPLGREQRRVPRPAGPRRRRLSSGACPPTALLARSHVGART